MTNKMWPSRRRERARALRHRALSGVLVVLVGVLFASAIALLAPDARVSGQATTAAITGDCILGATQAKTQGLPSANYLQGVVPQCLVTVYLTGTTTKATIFADGSNTALNNPFTATPAGHWQFYTAINQGYDVVLSGGFPPNVYTTPRTLVGLFPAQQVTTVTGPPLTFRGAFNPLTSYALGDGVSYTNGSSYVSLVSSNLGNIPPSSPSQWGLLAQAGANGSTGPAGPAGPQGPPGGAANISGQANGVLPLSTSVAGIAAQSHINENTAGFTSVTQPVAASVFAASGQPMSDIRNPSFAGGAKCDNSTDDTPALQAAVTALPAMGGNILIPASPTPCKFTTINTMNWGTARTGPVNLYLNGVMNNGTTLFLPPNTSSSVNVIGYSGGRGSQFVSPGQTAQIYFTPINGGNGTGTLGTSVSVTWGGVAASSTNLNVADPTGYSIGDPIVLSSTGTNGYTQNNTVSNIATVSTTGSVAAGSQALTVASGTGIATGDILNIAGAGPGCGPLITTTYNGGGGTTMGLNTAASCAVSGAAVTDSHFTLGTAAVNGMAARPGNLVGHVVTFTPSSMSGLVANAAIDVIGKNTCTLLTETRASNKVTATYSGLCDTPPNVIITIAGVADSSFNGTNTGGGYPQQFMLVSNDYVTQTMSWWQTGSAATSTGGTLVGMNADNIDHVQLTSCTSTTCTATFWRSHASTDNWGLVAVYMGNGNGASSSEDILQDISITDYAGTGLWMQSYLGKLTNVGITATGGPSTNYTSFGIEYESAFVHMTGMSVGGQPWGIRMSTPYIAPNGISGPLTITNSFVFSGIEIDHGVGPLTADDVVFDQAGAGAVYVDTTQGSWVSTQASAISISNSGFNDSPNQIQPNCNITFTAPALGAYGYDLINTIATLTNNSGTCLVNDYFTGTLNVISPQTPPVTYSTVIGKGVKGVYMDGKVIDAEVRGEQAGFSPAVITSASLPVQTNPASWSGSCTVATGQLAPDGSYTAGALTGSGGIFVETYNYTPTVGDSFLYGGWVYTPTLGKSAAAGGQAFAISDTGNHITFTTGNSFDGTTRFDPQLINDPWHTVVGLATIATADGSADGIRLDLGCASNQTMEYWQPFMVPYLAIHTTGTFTAGTAAITVASGTGIQNGMSVSGAGIASGTTVLSGGGTTSLTLSPAPTANGSGTALQFNVPAAELIRYQRELMHGWVPPSAAAQIAYSNYPINLPGDPTVSTQAATKHYVDSVAGLPIASTTVLGGMKCDGVTTTCASDGTVTASISGGAVLTTTGGQTITTPNTSSGFPSGCQQYPCLVAKIDSTAQTANISTATAYAVPSGKAGYYQISCYLVVTSAGTTSTLPQCNVAWTDQTSNAAVHGSGGASTMLLGSIGITGNAPGYVNFQNGYQNQWMLNVAQSTNITYNTTGYASTGTPMQYALHLVIEYVGP